MGARTTSDLTRHVMSTASKVRHATSTTFPRPKKAPKPVHGQQIFVYNHLQTNQVVYSLTKALKNNASLRQLPFNGKKTVPRALRKDLWSPLATISFPANSPSLGLSAFQKLREYRRLHELQWDDSLMKDEKGMFVAKKKRGRNICDQKANSVADIAAVLGQIGSGEGNEVDAGDEEGGKVEVRWRDLHDAEYAETWSENVIHDRLETTRNHRDPERLVAFEKEKLARLERQRLEEEENQRVREEKTRIATEKRAERMRDAAPPEKIIV